MPNTPAREIDAAERAEWKRHSDAVGVGMCIAAGILMSGFECPVQAEEIIQAAGLETEKKMRAAGVDDYDINLLRPVLRTIADRRALRGAQP